MRLIVLERAGVKRATFAVSYGAGSVDDPPGKEGLAHLAEHLAFRARPGGPGSPRLWDRLLSSGMAFNATTAPDHTDYFEIGKPDQLEELLNIEADRMRDPLAGLGEKEFLAERGVVAAELAQRFENYDGAAQLAWLVESGLRGHPYARSATAESLGRIELRDVRDWLRQNFGPAHAVLVLVSSMPSQQAVQAVTSRFGPLALGTGGPRVPPVQRPPPPWPGDPPRDAPLDVRRAPVERPQLWVGWTLPGDRSRAIARALAAEMVLRRQLENRLLTWDKDEVVDDVQVGLSRMDGASLLVARVDLRTEKDAEKVLGFVKNSLWTAPRQLWWQQELRDALLVEAYLEAEQMHAPKAAQFLRATGNPDVVGGWQQMIAYQLSTPNVSYVDEFLTPRRAFATLVVPDRNVTARELRASMEPPRPALAGDFTEAPEEAPLVAAQDPHALAAPPGLDRAERRLLPNGLEVVVARRGEFPVADVRLSFRTQVEGSAAAPRWLPLLALGLSHAGGGWVEDAIGAQRFADRGLEYYVHGERGSSGNLPALLETVGHWARTVHAGDGFKDARRRLEYSLEVALLRPSVRADVILRARLFPDHPYGGGWTHESIQALTSKQADEWVEEQVRPQRATLLVVSDVTPGPELWKAIESEFGGWSSDRGPAKPAVAPPAVPARRTVVLLDRPGATQALVTVGLRRPPRWEGDEAGLEALEWILRAQLMRSLRVERGVTYGVQVFGLDHAAAGALVLSTAVDQAAAADSLQSILDAIRRLGESPPSQAIADRARLQLARNHALAFDTASGAAGRLERIALHRLPPDYWERQAASTASLTPERIQAVARSVAIGRETVIVVADRRSVLQSLQAAGFEVEVQAEPASPAAR